MEKITVKAGTSSTKSTRILSSYDYYNISINETGTNEYKYGVGGTCAGFIFKGDLLPATNNQYTLGGAGLAWNNIYAITGEIGSSDKNEKEAISSLPESYEGLFDELEPVVFRFKQSDSGRLHAGLIAQQVKELLDKYKIDSKDFAAYCEWDKNDGQKGCGLRYTEFIPLCIAEIQKLKKRLLQYEINYLNAIDKK